MFEDEIRKLEEINKMLDEINGVMEACIRVMGSANLDSEDYNILEDFVQKQHRDEWVDEEWDEAMAALPQCMLLMPRPRE